MEDALSADRVSGGYANSARLQESPGFAGRLTSGEPKVVTRRRHGIYSAHSRSAERTIEIITPSLDKEQGSSRRKPFEKGPPAKGAATPRDIAAARTAHRQLLELVPGTTHTLKDPHECHF